MASAGKEHRALLCIDPGSGGGNKHSRAVDFLDEEAIQLAEHVDEWNAAP